MMDLETPESPLKSTLKCISKSKDFEIISKSKDFEMMDFKVQGL